MAVICSSSVPWPTQYQPNKQTISPTNLQGLLGGAKIRNLKTNELTDVPLSGIFFAIGASAWGLQPSNTYEIAWGLRRLRFCFVTATDAQGSTASSSQPNTNTHN